MSALELELLPDVERLVSLELRASAALAELVGDRVYTAWPKGSPDEVAQPLVLITRIGGEPPFSRPLVLDECDLQLDVYGGGKHLAHRIAATVRAALVELTDRVTELGVVHAVTLGALRYVPDESFAPARPRYVLDATVSSTPRRHPIEGS